MLKFAYMKIILAMALTSFFALRSSPQITIQNSQWKGKIITRGENVSEIKLEFRKDTLYTYRNETQLVSTFAFSQRHDTLTITKTGGSGQCAINSKGTYRIESLENGEKFHFRLLSDECPGRGTGWTAYPFERID